MKDHVLKLKETLAAGHEFKKGFQPTENEVKKEDMPVDLHVD